MGKIVIPKNSASIEEVMGAMQIYYDAGDWLSNADFIQAYKARIGIIGDDRDSSAYTKKTEIGAYYGFLEWEDIDNTQSCRRITARGREFLENYNKGDMNAVHENLMVSLEKVNFGRNNYACRSCDSDIEPPVLFLRAIVDLGFLTNTEFAYLIHKMEYDGTHYTETIQEIKNIRSTGGEIHLVEDAKKFKDSKSILILERLGVLKSQTNGRSKEIIISSEFYAKYENRIKNLKIYNIDKNINNNSISGVIDTNRSLPYRDPRSKTIYKLNTILYGAPGTGKTYSTAEYALKIVDPNFSYNTRADIMRKYREYIDSDRIVFTTFHQSYGYEDFIQGLRPNSNSGNLNFEPVDGIFKRIADKAMYDTENDYVIIIDEINRANISKVFGELITLIEDNKRWGEVNALSVTLPSGEVFAVPNNLYIIGTMNSADKSISLIDTALRRRFEFVEFVPRAELVTNELLKEIIVKLNKALKDEFENTDLLIGHAYFINKSEDDLCDIMNNSVIPLLYEYNYDNAKKVKTQLNEVLKDTDFKISASEFGRIKIEKSDANA